MKRLLLFLLGIIITPTLWSQNTHQLRYWFDSQVDSVIYTTDDSVSLIDVSQLKVGFHTLYIQVLNDNGQWSPQMDYVFSRVPTQENYSEIRFYYRIDESDYSEFTMDVDSNVLVGNINVENISEGIHTITTFIFIPGLGCTTPKTNCFMKMPLIDQLTLHYSFDNFAYQSLEVQPSSELVSLLLSIDSLPNGLHHIQYYFTSSQNGCTSPQNAVFVRPTYIERFEYWFNGNDSIKQVQLFEPSDTTKIITMFSVEHYPIRSTCFEFSPQIDTNPIVFAKNEILFRFWSEDGQFKDTSYFFVDETVSESIIADTIERNTTKTIAAPFNNNIHWFKLAVGTGDSLSFHTDRRCTMQLYSPSGEIVFHASGDSVLTWQGCHAWEEGVYYLAVHDAEGSENIAVSYQWIYRYAVLAWDVHRVGNGGISTITFEGNGFDSISNITLYNNSVDTIIPLAFYGCRSECSVTIDFTNVQQGLYSSSFIFGDYLIDISDILMVEPSVDITIGLSVEYANNFLRGTSAVYNVSITNYGNSTIYDVPIEIMIRNDTTINNIRRIRIVDEKDDEWGYSGTGILSDTLDVNVKTIINDILNNRTGLNLFFSVQDSLSHYENLNTMSLLTIPPYGQYKFRIEILSTDTVFCYVSIPYEWPFLIPVLADDDTSYHNSQIIMNSYDLTGLKGNPSKSQSSMCCEKEKYECITHTMADWASNISGVGCAVSTIDFFSFYAIELWCASEGSFSEKWYEFCYQQSHKNTPLRKATVEKGWNAILQCLTMSLDQYYKKLKELKEARKELIIQRDIARWLHIDENEIFQEYTIQIMALDDEIASLWNAIVELLHNLNDLKKLHDALVNSFRDVSECIQVWQNGTGCNDKQTDGGPQPPVNSSDPNDIIGYIAESGSHAISAEQQQMPYMIEFENDTAFATAHAHTVIVKDTLDGNVFDLNSFSATAFEIGDNVTTINGGQSFTRTVDMRPEIDVLAQVRLDYRIDTTFAVATWTFSSLDPMTLQTTIADTLGFLGIGGTGEVDFTINRKTNLPDSTIIDNRAWIIFDNEEPIATSTWRNIVDNTPPTSTIDTIIFAAGTTKVVMHATDNLSGAWQYHVYGQVADSIWLPLAMNIPIDSVALLSVDSSQYAAYLTTAVDSAGNVEPLKIMPSCSTVYDTIDAAVCDSYTWFDSLFTTSGSYQRTRTSALSGGCDSVTILNLTINYSSTGDTTAMACDSFTWWNTNYTNSTNETTHVFTNALGCDSTVTLHLTVNYSSTGDTTATTCDSFTWWGTEYMNSTNEATHVFANTAGCDSTVTLHLNINHPVHTAVTDTACGSYEWNGTEYVDGGDYLYSHADANGCNQEDTLHLTLFSNFTLPVAANRWYAISSPMHNSESGNSNFEIQNSNIADGIFDLYRYNESEGRWERPLPTEDAVLERGRGYIYRNADDVTLTFCGEPNSGNFAYAGIDDVDNLGDITNGCSDIDLRGFHLVGNPYPHKIYKGMGLVGSGLATGYYLLQPNGTWLARLDTASIAAGLAVLLKATEATALNFYDNTDAPAFGNHPTISFAVSDGMHSDVAYAVMEECGKARPMKGLMKIGHLGEGLPMLYIAQEGSRYSIVVLDEEVAEFPLVFRGTAGEYTLSTGSEDLGKIDYMHLIDLQDGNEVDLLAQSEYTFKADGTVRFLVRLSPRATSDGNDGFAFIDGDRIVVDVTQEALPTGLLVYDMMGRELFNFEISNTNFEIQKSLFPGTGVYVLRLGEKSQKIVVESKQY